MKDEIKEILEGIGETSKEQFVPIEFPLTIKECKILLDYITNLQEKNDYLKDIVSNTELSDETKKADKWSKRELYKINYQRLEANQRLQEENERLKSKIDDVVNKQQFIEEKFDYKSRIDKAIEWIRMVQDGNSTKYIEPIINTDELDELLNILQGSDKDDKF